RQIENLRYTDAVLLLSLFRFGALNDFARQQPQEHQPRNENKDTDQMSGRHPAAEIILRIITAENFDKRAHDGIANEVGSEDLPIKFLAPEKPGQRAVKQKIQQRFINLCRVQRHTRWSALSCGRKGDPPRQIARAPVAATIEQTTDSAKRMAECNAWGQNVRAFPKRQLAAQRIEDISQRSAD